MLFLLVYDYVHRKTELNYSLDITAVCGSYCVGGLRNYGSLLMITSDRTESRRDSDLSFQRIKSVVGKSILLTLAQR